MVPGPRTVAFCRGHTPTAIVGSLFFVALEKNGDIGRDEVNNVAHAHTITMGEDEAKKAYADVLDQDLPLPIRQLVAEQQAHILTSHDFVRSHRDALASK